MICLGQIEDTHHAILLSLDSRQSHVLAAGPGGWFVLLPQQTYFPEVGGKYDEGGVFAN